MEKTYTTSSFISRRNRKKRENRRKSNRLYFRAYSIPVNSSTSTDEKLGGRGSVVLDSKERDLNTPTTIKCQGESHSYTSKNLDKIPNGSKFERDLEGLYKRNFERTDYVNKDLFRMLRHKEL